MSLVLPEGYDPHMTVRDTQNAIKFIRDTFQKEFGREMNLERISAPLFVDQASGFNDNLNGVERPVQFDIKSVPGQTYEVVQSLAKWNNMNAIRRDEDLDNLHSCYVDQWDWEMVIRKADRTPQVLHSIVGNIFKIIKHMEHEVWYKWPDAVYHLPNEIAFVTTQELEERWPDKTRKERENLITKEKGAVFIEKIGWPLADGEPHDGRAPDYDDWNLNGDIIFWFEPLDVSEESMLAQLEQANCQYRKKLPYHKMLLNGELPYSIGGGIGQSRLCMLLLGRVHIGEVQASIWPEEMKKACAEKNVILL